QPVSIRYTQTALDRETHFTSHVGCFQHYDTLNEGGLEPNETGKLMPSTIGYARVSSTGQDLAIQEEELRKAGCNTIRSEKRSAAGLKVPSSLPTILVF